MAIFKLRLAEAKNEFLLFNEIIEKESEQVHDDYIFRKAKFVDIQNELYTTRAWGKKFVDFHFGLGDAIYINEKFVECLKTVGEKNYQLLPIVVYPGEKPYYILNILNLIDCVDRENSVYRLFTEEYGRPDLLGKFYTFTKMILDESKIPKDVHIFRLKGYEIAFFITNELASVFKKNKIKGFDLAEIEVSNEG